MTLTHTNQLNLTKLNNYTVKPYIGENEKNQLV